ncbi:MAG: hypothetical protein ACRDQ0_09220 [Pseudonocardia sp.]
MAAAALVVGLGLGGVGATFLTLAVSAPERRWWGAIGLIGLTFIGLAFMALRRLRRGASRRLVGIGVRSGVAVLRIRRSRAALVVRILAGSSAAIAGSLLAVSALQDRLTGAHLLVLLAASVAVYMVAPAAWEAAWPNVLELDPEQVRVMINGRETTVSWNAVRRVAVVAESHRLFGAGPQIHMGSVTIPMSRFAADPVLLFHLVQFYHSHPSSRSELGTPASVERLHSADFGAPEGVIR